MNVFAPSACDAVFNNLLLGTMIMDTLPISVLIALSFIDKTFYFRIHRYIRHKLQRIFVPFGFDRETILSILLFTDAKIVGMIALKAVAPLSLNLTPRNLDIVIRSTSLFGIEGQLELNGYVPEQPDLVPIDYPVPSRNRRSFKRTIDTREMFINVVVAGDSNQADEFLFYASNTTLMNSISRRGLFNGYRSLLNDHLAVRNHVDNMRSVSSFFDLTSPDRTARIDEINAKAEALGYRFLSTNSDDHWPTNCRCIPRSACPLELRNMNDGMCASMPVFTDDEFAHVRSRANAGGIPTSLRHPPVVWKLAGIFGGIFGSNEGYAIGYSR